jgi:hypothetical protein
MHARIGAMHILSVCRCAYLLCAKVLKPKQALKQDRIHAATDIRRGRHSDISQGDAPYRRLPG